MEQDIKSIHSFFSGKMFYWSILKPDKTVAGKIIAGVVKTQIKCAVILHGDERLTETNVSSVSHKEIGCWSATYKAILLCLYQANKISAEECMSSDCLIGSQNNHFAKWFRENGYTLSQEI